MEILDLLVMNVPHVFYDSLLHVISIFYQHPSIIFPVYTCTMVIEPAWPARIWFFIIPMPFYTGCWRLEFDVRVPYSTQYKKSCCDQKDWILTALLVVHTIYTSCSKHFRAMLGSRPIKFIKWWSSFTLFIWRLACCRWDLSTKFGQLWCRNKY